MSGSPMRIGAWGSAEDCWRRISKRPTPADTRRASGKTRRQDKPREEKMRMWKTLLAATAVAAAGALVPATSQAQDKTLTLCWAAWDPANALVELSKDFTAKTGIQMKYEFVPWTSYADRFLNELNS